MSAEIAMPAPFGWNLTMSSLGAPTQTAPSPAAGAADSAPQDDGLDEFFNDLKRLATPPSQLFIDYFGPGAVQGPPDQV